MNYNPVGWFEIPATDMQRAKAFYEAMLGIQISEQRALGFTMGWFPMDMDTKGAAGSLVVGDGYTPGTQGPVIYFTCPDIEGALERAAANGGSVKQPLESIGEFGEMALVNDSEGNVIGLHRAPGAKA